MDKITLKNFRCFHEEQTARLAPLTLLVGENSTGKTSFMAMIRALSDIAYGFRNPDFKEDPYDLGSFDEIAHYRGAGGGRADTFEAGFCTESRGKKAPAGSFEITFGKSGTTPVPVRRRLSRGKTWIDESFGTDEPYALQVGTLRGAWEVQVPDGFRDPSNAEEHMPPLYYILLRENLRTDRSDGTDFAPVAGGPPIISKDRKVLNDLARYYVRFHDQRPFASAPVRSKPHRTYDPSRPTPDPEGDYVPMYLADVSSRNKEMWTALRKRLEGFGKSAGLFDEISIKRLGKRDSEPFRVQVRKSGGRLKGPWRNLIDVGYGVSQALPVITEMLREDAPPLFLLQQPEVHLHPSAQAALGSLFCQVASPERQFVVETHSDHLIDRVRMDVRDGKSNLKTNDVSILYFERGDLDVNIRSLQIDEDGNIVGAPDGYRSFFMEETARSLWRL